MSTMVLLSGCQCFMNELKMCKTFFMFKEMFKNKILNKYDISTWSNMVLEIVLSSV